MKREGDVAVATNSLLESHDESDNEASSLVPHNNAILGVFTDSSIGLSL